MSEMHTVEQGEHLGSIADAHGFSDWKTIWEHPQNASLRQKRHNPNVLLPGDQLYIPDKSLKQEPGATEQRHRFQVNIPKAWIRFVVKDNEGEVLSKQPYRFTVSRTTFMGTTDDSGSLRHEIPVNIDLGYLSLTNLGLAWKIRIGHLDPVHDEGQDSPIISGLQARLNNLGYFAGTVDGILGPQTTAALQEFQRIVLGRNDPDGEPDQETRNALRDEHGC